MRRVLLGIVLVLSGTTLLAVAQLPPEILADQYLLQADQQITNNDHEGALESLQKILALQKEHGLTLPEAFHFKYAQVAFAAGSFPAALESVNQYLVMAGREGEFYRKALELLLAIKAVADRTPCDGQPKGAECWLELTNQAGCYIWNPQFEPYKGATWTGGCSGGVARGRGTLKWIWEVGDTLYKEAKKGEKAETPITPQFRAGTPSKFRDEPTCSGRPKGASCWMELENQPGCYIWNPNLQVDGTVTWTGECVEGIAQGTGTSKWVWDSAKKTSEGTGELQEGKVHGAWVIQAANGIIWEGPYEAGKRHGEWVFRIDGWGVGGGPYVRGKRHGPWVLSGSKGGKWEGSFVEGSMHGNWVRHEKDGVVHEGPILNGKWHGHWVQHWASGNVWEGPFVENKRHGQWVWRKKDGRTEDKFYVEGKVVGSNSETGVLGDGHLVNGKMQGGWTLRRADGDVEEGPYVEGKRHGQWVFRFVSGTVGNRPFVDGRIHGQLTGRDADGNTWETSYVEGKKHGHFTRRTAEGKVSSQGPFVEGQKHGAWTEGNRKGVYVEGKRHGRWVVNPGGENERSIIYDSRDTYDPNLVDSIRPEMVKISGGSFRMGCVSGRNCHPAEHPVHTVRVGRFELSKYEVTFEEYDRFTAATGREPADDKGWGRGRRPVIDVSWEDAVAYTRWLSEQTGERYRLPSEAEWEYAARAGTATAYNWGNEIGRNRANCNGCGSRWGGGQPAPVGSFSPNSWGLHDMHGNVREWVQDCYNWGYQGAPTNGSAWESGNCSRRVLRGGSYIYGPGDVRSANRYRGTPGFRFLSYGFRVARTITP